MAQAQHTPGEMPIGRLIRLVNWLGSDTVYFRVQGMLLFFGGGATGLLIVSLGWLS